MNPTKLKPHVGPRPLYGHRVSLTSAPLSYVRYALQPISLAINVHHYTTVLQDIHSAEKYEVQVFLALPLMVKP